jgi:hypothetical protein
VAQWIAHQTSDLGVGGSSPPRDWTSMPEGIFFGFVFWPACVVMSVLMVFSFCELYIVVCPDAAKHGAASLAEWLRRWL